MPETLETWLPTASEVTVHTGRIDAMLRIPIRSFDRSVREGEEDGPAVGRPRMLSMNASRRTSA